MGEFMIFRMLINNENQKSNSNTELEKISKEYYLPVYKYCNVKLGAEKSYSDDITDEIFALLCEKWDSLRKENVKAWIYRTADNIIKEFLRKHRKQLEEFAYIEDLDDFTVNKLTYDQDFESINNDDIETYRGEILSDLSDDERELFDAVFVKKLPHKEICEQFSLSKENLKKRLYRLRKKLTESVYVKINK